jgi:hypothetical protein
MEIDYVPLAQARRGNRTQVEEWLATYTRLSAELAALGRRLAATGGAFSPAAGRPSKAAGKKSGTSEGRADA